MKTKAFCVFILTFLFIVTAYPYNKRDSLRMAIKTEKDDVRRYHAMTLLATELIPSEMDSARVLLEAASSLANAVDNPLERAAWLNISGNLNWYTGNTDSAMANYSIVYYMDSPEIINRKAAAAVNLASLYNRTGETDSARIFHVKARELFILLDDQAGLAHVNRSLGIAYFRQNNYELALRHYLEAMQYQENVQDTFALIYIYSSMGNVLKNLSDFHQAEYYFKKAIHLFENFPKTPHIGSVYNNLALLYKEFSDEYPGISIKYAKMGLEALKKHPDISIEFGLYGNLGMFYYDKGDYVNARKWFEKTDHIDKQKADVYLYAGYLNNYGRLLVAEGNYRDARSYFNQSIEVAERVGSFSRKETGYLGLFHLDSLLGNYIAAIAHLQQRYQWRDSIWQKDRSDRISELRILHEIDKKEAENKLLREANLLKEEVIEKQRQLMFLGFLAITLLVLLIASLIVSRKRIQAKRQELEILHFKLTEKQAEVLRQNELLDNKNKELQVLIQTKDKFFSIISHDLRGPFNSLLGFLNILVEDSEQMDHAQRQEILESLKYSSERTYDMLTNLLEWSLIQRGKISNNPVNTLIKSVVDDCLVLLQFNITKKEHEVVNLVDETLSANLDPGLLRSILVNLINNSVKFTHRGGQLKICAEKSSETDSVSIRVNDNGIGIPEEHIDSLFQLNSDHRRAGTERETGTGLGLITIKEIITVMGGDIKVESEPGIGSTFCVTIPG